MWFLYLIDIVAVIITLVAEWDMFKKMGYEGWRGIIPGYNVWLTFKELYGNGNRCFMLLIPFYNIYLLIKYHIDWAHAFNKTTGWGWGMAWISFVFYPLTAWDKKIVYRDGSMANNEHDFMDTVAEKAHNVVENVQDLAENKEADNAAERLKDLKELHDSGVVTDEEYEAKRKELVDKL